MPLGLEGAPRVESRLEKEVPMLGIGAEAPAFSVQDHRGETVRLADLRGQKVLLWFYPKADTPG